MFTQCEKEYWREILSLRRKKRFISKRLIIPVRLGWGKKEVTRGISGFGHGPLAGSPREGGGVTRGSTGTYKTSRGKGDWKGASCSLLRARFYVIKVRIRWDEGIEEDRR